MPAESHEGGDGDLAVARPEEGVGDTASVELTHGNQVEGGDEEADPRRKGYRVHEHVMARGEMPKSEPGHEAHQEGIAEHHAASRGQRRHLGPSQADPERGESDHEPGQRAGGRDVEQRVPVAGGRAHADDGAQGSEEERRRSRDEVRQAHRRAIGPRREVVAELVGAENGEQGEGEGHAVEDAPGIRERIEGKEGARSGDDGRQHGQDKQDDVRPRLRRHVHVHERQRAHPGHPRPARLEERRIAEGPEARHELGESRGGREEETATEADRVALGTYLLYGEDAPELGCELGDGEAGRV